jgi:hypothetical protein
MSIEKKVIDRVDGCSLSRQGVFINLKHDFWT